MTVLLTGRAVLAGGMKEYEGTVGVGFTIPQIDLDERADLQVAVCRDPDKYLGHPSSVLLDDGKTMVIMYLDRHGRGNLMWQRSEDAGVTWSERLPLPDGWDEKLTIEGKDHPQFLEVPILYKINGKDGRQRIMVYTAGRYIYPARYAVSEDDGVTWSPLRPILFGGKELTASIVLFSDMLRLKSEAYLATWHGPKGQVKVAETSDGITFGEVRPAVSHPEAFLCEACLIRSPDGNTIAMLMRENARRFNSFISFSRDEGKTWSNPREAPGAITGDRHQHVYTPDGRLFISFRDRGHETPSYGDWVAWIGTFKDLEQNREGEYRIRLKENFRGTDCAYPTVHLLPDNTIFCATYGQWEKKIPNYILSLRLRMDQLDRLCKAKLNR